MSDSLKKSAELRQFVLENVEHFGEERVLGTGSYGSVQEVKINGEVYAAKMIHEVLLETDEHGGVTNIATNYLRECKLMARIRHPNITQFIGLCFLARYHLPLLVMERLDCSLDELLESTPNIPLSVSQYILVCVARGLLHLHRESVVHRDLTARNVLLTASLRAKITDFGNSRIVNLEPSQLARTLTRFPGTLVYMPPEALSDSGNSVYGPRLDIFSFGVLQLFTLTQVFPGDLLAPTYHDPANPDLLLARSEFERRSTYTVLLERGLAGGQGHPLFNLVRDCLSNAPERRPSSSELLSSLEEIGTETEGGLLQLDIARVKTARALKTKERRIETLQRELAEKETQLMQKGQLLNLKTSLLANKETRIAELMSRIEAAEVLIQACREQIGHKDAELAKRTALIQQLEYEGHVFRGRSLSTPAASKRGPLLQELRPPLTLKWRRGEGMPIRMSDTVQSVVIEDAVFISGGFVDSGTTVIKLDLKKNTWTELPEYSVIFFGISSIDSHLVILGGYEPKTSQRTNKIAVFHSGIWTHPYPPMKIARYCPTAVSFNTYIIVAGGYDREDNRISSVEVLDVSARRWYTAQSLPKPRSSLKSALTGNTLYLMGGFNHAGYPTKMVHHVDLNELITKAVSNQDSPTLWQTIKDTPLMCSAPLNIGRSLLAVGGCDGNDKPSSSIHLYQPDYRRWVKVGDLPTAPYHCTCSVLPNGEVIAAQISSKEAISTVDFLSISSS